jgi:hypothetical protein
MNERVLPNIRRRIAGQTLVIALIVLGVLLILGFVFLGLIDRSLHNQSQSESRSEANDLAEAAIRYAHAELLTSELGADYRGTPFLHSPQKSTDPISSSDPDLFYLRPGSGFGLRSPSDGVVDEGGPDGLGPFIRINFSNGRGLFRIRYAPSDANLFTNSPVGALRNPGAARDYLIIEAVGRTGQVLPNDPTTANRNGSIKFTSYSNWNDFHTNVVAMQSGDSQSSTSRRMLALQAIGITEQTLFFTNVDHVNRPAEIGIPDNLGATYTTIDATGTVTPIAVGNTSPQAGAKGLQSFYGSNLAVPTSSVLLPGSGSIRSNADLEVYGTVNVSLNQTLGEGVNVAGSIIPASANSNLVVKTSSRDPLGNWTVAPTVTLSSGLFDTRLSTFNTVQGAIRDGMGNADSQGYTRSVSREEPPSLSVIDQATGKNRYLEATKESGALVNGVNTGAYGYGSGVYVDNYMDRQNPSDETGRQNVGSQQSLLYDWLNPNNGQSGSGWQGPFYIPTGAFLELLPDGFIIQRDTPPNPGSTVPSASVPQFWANPDGSSSGSRIIRYRVGLDSEGKLRILNSIANYPLDMSGVLKPADYENGFLFNGVLYFEGNVRVRGFIPTDVQLMVVSNASIYIEGSIIKGDVDNDVTAPNATTGNPINHAPKAMMMLAAKDYVALNTTMFYGPSPTFAPQVVSDVPNDQQYKPIYLDPTQTPASFDFVHEFTMNDQPTTQYPGINPNNPQTYRPYLTDYVDAVTPTNSIVPKLTVVHTMDNGPAASTFVSMLINYQGNVNAATYFFGSTSSEYATNGPILNAAYGLNGSVGPQFAEWGLGAETWQRYTKFEADNFAIAATGTNAFNSGGLTIAAPTANGTYQLNARNSNDFMFQPKFFSGTTSNDYLLSRFFVTPDDIKIQASIFAEEGSFFVIPGQWANPNPADRHDLYPTWGANSAEQDTSRLENYGSNPEFPFYGEPLDIRITITGAITQNMPVPIALQAESLRKWGWIPAHHGSSTAYIPAQHVPSSYNVGPGNDLYVPNLFINYDPVLATAGTAGYTTAGAANAVRVDDYGRVLPPIPRLPVSPALAYFGEAN